MVLSSEIVATAAASFLLGWTLKNNNLLQILKRARNSGISKKLKLVIVVRTDLGMSRGKIASQCSHATLACYKQGLLTCPDVVKEWELLGQPKVILKTNLGGENLRNLAKEAANSGLVAALIRDAGRTEVPSATLTVLGIGPECASKIDKITSSLHLL